MSPEETPGKSVSPASPEEQPRSLGKVPTNEKGRNVHIKTNSVNTHPTTVKSK